jgi:hypothetical protein
MKHEARGIWKMTVAHRALRVALEALTEGEKARIPTKLRNAAATAFDQNSRWTTAPEIQGFGIGYHLHQEGLAIKVYVERSVLLREARTFVPEAVSLRGVLTEEVPIDVVHTGKITLDYPPIRGCSRPVIIGSSGAHRAVQGGTIGLLVRLNGYAQDLYLLSACHTFARQGLANHGDPIIQPSLEDGGTHPASTVAALASWVPITFTATGYPNRADAALAKVTDPGQPAPDIHIIGAPNGVSRARLRTVVHKMGRTTGYTLGMAIDLDFKFQTQWPHPLGGTARAGFSGLVLCTKYACQGDSGAAVLNRRNRILGIHMGGDDSSSFFCKIQHAMALLNCRLP